ncbi:MULTISPECIES: ankyrin repeat domain-containing protein [unclassified Arcicella]|uniref:ankyrin repeat domain-containing protein n=1 Tax=unclassified Arcicella TaxID=2644986 RepID=UPI002865F495|nr:MULTISPECIES: ankyrin repeat domain-containing protein [unclassified Arcicella]MDR6562200.1 ankyrin repeat protein [Arcicella sp. BE51]MDR6812106.1 ankyrin repeat protein [Arcicella sp. BE140]MDR6823417.1 ankyrin repeat protein [Arcicella sp. BE139]
MKKLFIVAITLLTFAAKAQQNTLLEQSFWRSKPTVSTVKAEVEKGNNPAQLNGASFDPVVMAINAKVPNETILYLLSQPGNDITKITHDSRTYLHWAASTGNVEIMEYLIGKGAKADIEDSHGATPLNFAASAGQTNTQIFDLCLKAGANLKKDLTNEGANALLLVVANDKDFTLTNYFISKGLDLKSTDANGNNAFSYAARSGNIEILKALLQKGVPATDNAMIMAAQGTRQGANTIETFQYLESLKLKPTATNKNGENALHFIVRKPKQHDIIQYFLSKGTDVNQADSEGNTAFMTAALGSRDTTVLALLLPKVKNINQGNQKGVTALAMAVRSNSPDVVRYLINQGASIQVADKNGDNLAAYLILSYSSGEGRGPNGPKPEDFETKLKLLQAKGLNVLAPQKNGNTLYHLAVAKSDLSLLKRLQPLGIDINAKNSEGITALHKAAMIAKDDNILKYLVSIGAAKDAQTNFKETAFDLASENETLSKAKISINFLK